MQIRERRNSFMLIRTQYDPAIKRGRSVSLGSVSLYARSIPSEVDALLRPSEREQLQAFLATRRLAFETALQERSARDLETHIRRATDWYERQCESTELAAQAKAVRDAFTGLLAAMVRAGVGRKRQRTKKSA